jgi:hypothetical protein
VRGSLDGRGVERTPRREARDEPVVFAARAGVVARHGIRGGEPAVGGQVVRRDTDRGQEHGDRGDAVADAAQRRGAAEQCGKLVRLESFDARRWSRRESNGNGTGTECCRSAPGMFLTVLNRVVLTAGLANA